MELATPLPECEGQRAQGKGASGFTSYENWSSCKTLSTTTFRRSAATCRICPCRGSLLPKLILADEPTGNLDSKNGIEIMNLLSELNREGTTIVMVTHSDRDAGFAQRTINMLDGQIILGNKKKDFETSNAFSSHEYI